MRRVTTALLGLGLMAATSACTVYEDGSYRTDDGTTGCLVPSWGCTGPLVDPIVELGPPPAPPCRLSLVDDTWSDGPCPARTDDDYVITHDYAETGDDAVAYDECRADGGIVFKLGGSVVCANG
jgi:hypothetical protein